MTMKRIALALAATIAGAFLTVAPATADDTHQAATARFYGHCRAWDVDYSARTGVVELEVDIKYAPAFGARLHPGDSGVYRGAFRHNEVPKLVQVYADGVLIRERLFGCGYFRR